MTLVVAIGCTDGVVIASDSASTDLEAGTKQPAIKVRAAGAQPLIWGCSGDVGLIQKVSHKLDTYKVSGSIFGNRSRLQDAVNPIMRKAIQSHVSWKSSPDPPVAITLIGLVCEGVPAIIEINHDGSDTHFDDSMGSFAAIGSGKSLAHALFRLYQPIQRNLEIGKLLAYRVLDDAIGIAAYGLDHPIQMMTLKADGTINKCLDPELEKLRETCEVWRELALETVGNLLDPTPHRPQPIPVPPIGS